MVIQPYTLKWEDGNENRK